MMTLYPQCRRVLRNWMAMKKKRALKEKLALDCLVEDMRAAMAEAKAENEENAFGEEYHELLV